MHFFLHELRVFILFKNKALKEITLLDNFKNVFGKKNDQNGYQLVNLEEEEPVTGNYNFQMAGRNLMFGLNISF